MLKKNIKTLLHETSQRLRPLYDSEVIAAQNAWYLLEKVTDSSEEQLIIAQEVILSPEQEAILHDMLDRLTQQHMPLQYILGSVPFLDITVSVEPPVLIPRPETEEWCATLIETLKKNNLKKLSILDLCTGSGCIALALAQALPESFVIGTDIHKKALALAEKNRADNQIINVEIIYADIYNGMPTGEKFDLIVSNPPYIAPEEWPTLQPEVKDWEDKAALVAPEHGLAILAKIIAKAPPFLKGSLKSVPALWLEIGYQQGPVVKAMMEQAGFTKVTIIKDLYGKDRVVTGYYEVS